jgi:hypothetical protein
MTKATRAILPGQVSWGSARGYLRNGMQKVGQLLLKEHQDATSTWDPKVDFELKVGKIGLQTTELTAEVTTDDERYLFVDQGTRPHVIRPRKAKVLAFPTSYTPKTRPGEIGSGHGSKGGPTVYAQEVHHPGTKPRKFSEGIAERSKDTVEGILQEAMQKAAEEVEDMLRKGGPGGNGV